MVKVDVVARKVARASAWLNDAEEILRRPAEEFTADVKSRDLASFYLFLAIQECIDLAAHWVSNAGWNVPDDAAATCDLLAEHGALDEGLAAALRGAIGLRNRIAHGYASVDHTRVHAEYRARLLRKPGIGSVAGTRKAPGSDRCQLANGEEKAGEALRATFVYKHGESPDVHAALADDEGFREVRPSARLRCSPHSALSACVHKFAVTNRHRLSAGGNRLP